MQPIKIGYTKRLLVPFLIFASLFIVGVAIYILFSEKYKNNFTDIFIKIVTIGLPAYFIVKSWQKVLNKKPALIFTDHELKIHSNSNPVCFRWNEITYWKVEEDKDNGGYRLLIESDTQKENFSLNWLEKPPKEIEKLIMSYTSAKS